MTINIKLNYCRIKLNGMEEIICADGFKRKVNAFRVDSITKSGKSAVCVFYNNNIGITNLCKRIAYKNEEMNITVNGNVYKIGNYEEV